MEVIKKVKLTKEEMDAICIVESLASRFTKGFPNYTMLEAVDCFFEALAKRTNEIEVI